MTANESTRWPVWIAGRRPARTLVRGLVLAVVCVIVFRFLLRMFWTEGSSMEPTVADRSLHLVNMTAFWKQAPQRGDIVVIRNTSGGLFFLKRVLGLPGEAVQFKAGRLLVNGAPLEEPYVQSNAGWNSNPSTVGANQYFVVGDNRGMPIQEHSLGMVEAGLIAGRLIR